MHAGYREALADQGLMAPAATVPTAPAHEDAAR
ncbi:hypothetical protein BPC006_II0084 [Burkholderia pseudomallei BPC006]|nr:hypothetical protein BPC006_II0084 [Burkholderia pseudomallei BPC006]